MHGLIITISLCLIVLFGRIGLSSLEKINFLLGYLIKSMFFLIRRYILLAVLCMIILVCLLTKIPEAAQAAGLPGVPAIDAQVLPFRMYNLIWNEWFRNQNTTDPILINTGDDVTNQEELTYHTLRNAAKPFDMYTTALPSPQKGDPVDIPLPVLLPLLLVLIMKIWLWVLLFVL